MESSRRSAGGTSAEVETIRREARIAPRNGIPHRIAGAPPPKSARPRPTRIAWRTFFGTRRAASTNAPGAVGVAQRRGPHSIRQGRLPPSVAGGRTGESARRSCPRPARRPTTTNASLTTRLPRPDGGRGLIPPTAMIEAARAISVWLRYLPEKRTARRRPRLPSRP